MTEAASAHHEEVVARPELGTLREWSVRVTIFEQGDDTTATVALLADSPEALTARGTSRRSGVDPEVTHIGDEVAVARALRRLADHLLTRAEHDIEATTGEQRRHRPGPLRGQSCGRLRSHWTTGAAATDAE